MISCSIEWNRRTLSVMSFNITIAVVVYLIPLLVLLVANAKIILTVSFAFMKNKSLN